MYPLNSKDRRKYALYYGRYGETFYGFLISPQNNIHVWSLEKLFRAYYICYVEILIENPSPFNSIVLRKTEIAYNFGLSECNSVKHHRSTLLHPERPKLHTTLVLKFLSAKMLNYCTLEIPKLIAYNSVKLLHSERPKLHTILAFMSAIVLIPPRLTQLHSERPKLQTILVFLSA